MRSPDQVRRDFLRQWIKKAESDLKAAQILISFKEVDYDSVGFHAQQAAEKFIKALLVKFQIEFGKTHQIRVLRHLLSEVSPKAVAALKIADWLTPLGTDFRYPGDYQTLSKSEALQAVKCAVEVHQIVMQMISEDLEKK